LHFTHPEHGTVSIHKQPSGEFHVKHQGAMAGLKGVAGSFSSAGAAGAHAKNYMNAVSQKKILAPKMHDRASPNMVGKFTLNKAMEAGSAMAAPSQLTQGAALGIGFGIKKKKSQSLLRAEQAYGSWEKREEFEKFMKEKLPKLTKNEIKAIGQVLALKKSMKAEDALAKFASHYFKDEEMEKTTDILMASEKKK
jgi:hypothetical protein